MRACSKNGVKTSANLDDHTVDTLVPETERGPDALSKYDCTAAAATTGLSNSAELVGTLTRNVVP